MIHTKQYMKQNYNCTVKLKNSNLTLFEPNNKEQESANRIINTLPNRDIENIIVCGFTKDGLPFYNHSLMNKSVLSLILFNVQDYVRDSLLE